MDDCKKLEQRTLFSLFKIFSCQNCNNECLYDYIYVGNNVINIYRLNNECINDIKKQEMIKLFLKECIINKEGVFIIIDEKEYIRYFDIFPLFIENNNLFILCI